MAVTGLLAHARRANAERSWLEARDAFARADRSAPLDAEDLGLWATAELMLAQDEAAVATLERAHYRYLERGETVRAVRPAIWIGMNLAYGGAVGPASGWLGRAQRLLDQEPGESADHGYLLLPLVFRHEAAGEYEEAAAVAGQAAVVGQRFGDPDLLALAVHRPGGPRRAAADGRRQETRANGNAGGRVEHGERRQPGDGGSSARRWASIGSALPFSS
jgi:hypothetical protein